MLPDLLTLASRLTLVGGKGGVGKTTTAASLAVALAERGREVVVVSVDPAHSLGDALGMELGGEPTAVPGVPHLRALEVDAAGERERFLRTGRGALLSILQRGSYLDEEDAGEVVGLTLPGLDELAAVFRLLDLTSRPGHHLVVDTAPTGHTLRLLQVPRLAREWLGALEAMEEKHRAVSLALAGGYQPDEAARFLADAAADLDRFSALLTDPALTRFLLVTNPEPVVLAETKRYAAALAERGMALAGIVVNRASAPVPAEALGAGMAFVPLLPQEPRGADGLLRFAASARAAAPSSAAERVPASAPGIAVLGSFRPPLDRSLYLVGGKGGVGKSTAAAALALLLAEHRPGTLLLGTDPAGSLGDLLGQEVGAEPRAVDGAPGLRVQQLDATLAWSRFRDRYREEAGELFGALTGGGVSAEADRAVVERLVDLAPPGVDELMALLEVVDASEDRPYDPLVLDTAPTGHLLRLLELPDLALEWTHALLRLLLKYREAIGLGSLADRVLRLARSLRAFRARLSDPDATWFLAVALPESLAVPETRRLLDGLRGLRVPAGALLVNRLLDGGVPRGRGRDGYAAALAALAGDLPCAAGPDTAGGVRGVADLRRFADSWRSVRPVAAS
jgi:arsenite-transporting ATPase